MLRNLTASQDAAKIQRSQWSTILRDGCRRAQFPVVLLQLQGRTQHELGQGNRTQRHVCGSAKNKLIMYFDLRVLNVDHQKLEVVKATAPRPRLVPPALRL